MISKLCAVAVDECREGNTCAANRAFQERNFLCTCGRTFHMPGRSNKTSWFCNTFTSPGFVLRLH